MNPFTAHALADARHTERYQSAAAAAPAVRRGHPRAALHVVRRRLGVLLVEAGLHLMARSEPAPRVSSPLAR